MNCGVAQRKITPERPVRLAGYGSRNKESEGVYQDIFLRALAMEESGSTAVIVSSDILYYDASILDPVESLLGERLGLAPAQIFFTATHTHCAPVVRKVDERMYGPRDEEYARFLCDSLVEVVSGAVADLSPCTLSYHRGSCDIAINRRVVTGDGVQMRPNPAGPVDHDVDVLVARDAAGGNVRAVVFAYACHATTMGGYLVGGDHPGVAEERLEQEFPSSAALFLQACTGDIRPNNVDENVRFRSGPVDVVYEFGNRLAESVLNAIENDGVLIEGELRTSDEVVQLPLAGVPAREELERRSGEKAAYVREWATRLLADMDAGIPMIRDVPVHVQTLRIGDSFALAAIAGEACAGIGLRIKSLIGDAPRMVIGYTNRSMSYIPSKDIYAEGGYEVDGAYYWEGFPAPYAPDVEDYLVASVRRQLE